jgi:hypothetical protein
LLGLTLSAPLSSPTHLLPFFSYTAIAGLFISLVIATESSLSMMDTGLVIGVDYGTTYSGAHSVKVL